MESATLQCSNIVKSFGGVIALDNVSLAIPRGRITGIIGPNGSGKSTLIDVISGFLKPDAGEVTLLGKKITNLAPYRISRMGLARTFQITKSFGGTSVLENVMVAHPKGICPEAKVMAEEILSKLKLAHLKNEMASGLSYGQQKLLGLGRVMIRNPSIILMDEPFSGINPVIQEEIVSTLFKLRDKSSIALVEHDMKMISRVCDHTFVLDRGQVICEGTPDFVLSNQKVVDAYLG
ncbi:MAG: ABC transporter ATP-binding protein [Nitrososphaerota archaeon]|nr:ABC transporter ATP-binding protein [Nitrososphaerota archaeon]